MMAQRPRTRLPWPLRDQIRFAGVGMAYRASGAALAPFFRRRITLADLAEKKILILKPCCLGDVIFATPLLRELRRALPTARLFVGVGAHSRPALMNNPHLDGVLDTGPVGSGRYTGGDYFGLVERLRREHFDACLVLERSALLGLLPLLARIPRRIGIDSGGRGFALSVGVSARPVRPESELYLDLLRAIGGEPADGELEFHPSPADEARVARLWSEVIPAGRPLVAIHAAGGTNPGMVLLRKRWPISHYRDLIKRIVAAGGSVILVGAPEDRSVVGELIEADGVIDLVGQLSLGEVAALARRADVYVGNDSGPTHLAEAAGAQVVMLFGPSDPIVYGPRGPRAVAVSAGLPCSPCFEFGRIAPCAQALCMTALSVDRVWHAVKQRAGFRQVAR